VSEAPEAWRLQGTRRIGEKAIKLHLSILGANNQHVVPNSPQPWAEYYSAGSRWMASKGRRWENPPRPRERGHAILTNSIASLPDKQRRLFPGAGAWQYTVRGNGCTSCPIRCHTLLKVPAVAAKYGIPEYGQNTCGGLNFGPDLFQVLSGRAAGADLHRSLHGGDAHDR